MIRALAIVYVLARVAHADEKSPPRAAAAPEAREPFWHVYAAFRNDALSELDPPLDDQGFTHDNVFALRRESGDYTLGGSFVHRFITSRTSRDRSDLVELFATAERSWPDVFAATWPRLTATLRAGPSLGGNWGGRYIQNGFHFLTKTGPTLDEGLQDRYPGGRTVGFALGGRARLEVGDRVVGYGFADGQLALGGTGVTSMQTAVGLVARSTYVGAHAEVALTGYALGDPYLMLPGGYREGFHVEWRAGIAVHWSRFSIGYEYRANESGSGEPMGVVEFSSRR